MDEETRRDVVAKLETLAEQYEDAGLAQLAVGLWVAAGVVDGGTWRGAHEARIPPRERFDG